MFVIVTVIKLLVLFINPHTFCEAYSNHIWQQATTEELQAFEKTGTWNLVDLRPDKSFVGCLWIYKTKTCSVEPSSDIRLVL